MNSHHLPLRPHRFEGGIHPADGKAYTTSGTIRINGQDIGQMDDKRLAHLRGMEIGFVFQKYNLVPRLTVLENVLLPTYANKRPNTDVRRRAVELLDMVGLADKLSHKPSELSGGQSQRVAIARAMAHKPRVIFADEPTAELDTNTGLQVIKIFKELAASDGITFVMTTHDTGLMDFGDRVYELKDGELVNE